MDVSQSGTHAQVNTGGSGRLLSSQRVHTFRSWFVMREREKKGRDGTYLCLASCTVSCVFVIEWNSSHTTACGSEAPHHFRPPCVIVVVCPFRIPVQGWGGVMK